MNDMRASDVARSVMRLSDVTQQSLAEKYGKGGQSTISMMLQNRNIKVDNLLMILNECGYDLVARSRDRMRPEFVIDDGMGGMGSAKESEMKLREMIRVVLSEELDRRERGKANPQGLRYTDDELYNDTDE